MNIQEAAEQIRARGESAPRAARDPVNEAMIRNWTEALGDRNPRYPEVAPPAMVQVWTMHGLGGERPTDDPLGAMTSVLDEAGYTSVVATDCEQTYHRDLRPGEQLTVRARLTDVVGPKKTALGEGWFFTTISTWSVGDEPVAEMMFRILKFRPPAPESPVREVLRPAVNRDTEYFWTGMRERELRIWRCGNCRLLRHPPGPMCPSCGATTPEHQVASGAGTVYSFVVHHHPPVPGREPPFVIALVELEEGVRVMGELRGVDWESIAIGLPVVIDFDRIDDELTLPAWRSA
ncbi:bifunctional MaoC family dehydratase N-terminal/OB-fold nucleic acid binding domain-containing protein [Pseudonocardia spinosispora]|uniref:bifunctional MaoC family dehydratase N-terminal/OB-fold nucleic acid binding domain-containing protein n=1 Tax=Pseudonocardia spinosispora TaxID=103441 RepID=UPI0004196F4B|nr:OB-fold domain-containing protein [Pseudonocardia spinosispora]